MALSEKQKKNLLIGGVVLGAGGLLAWKFWPKPKCTSDSECQTTQTSATGATQWISSGSCTEKEQKQQEYRNYYCDTSGDHTCKYTVTQGPKWVDTGNTRNKADGTSCTNGTCQNGVCITYACTSDSQCPADGWVDI